MKTYNINEALERALDPQESLFTWDELYIVKLICRNSVISNDEISVDKIKFLCSNFRIDKSGELLYTDMGVSRLRKAFNEDFAKVDEQSDNATNESFPFGDYDHLKGILIKNQIKNKMYNISNINDNYNTTISKFCDELNIGRNRFYAKMRELGILDEINMPITEYHDYFVEYYTDYSETAGKPSYYITHQGKSFIRSLLSDVDLAEMKKSKNAKERHQTRYKHYHD